MTDHTTAAPDPAFTTPPGEVSAGAFNNLLEAFERVGIPLAAGTARAAAGHAREAVRQAIEGHITDAAWRGMLHKAREAAGHGAHEALLLRFQSDACTDRGRALAAQEPGWDRTLTGDAAAIFQRWRTDLAPHGFTLTGRILEFPGGKPGEAGLYLGWRG